jgi:ribosome-binding ATPase YchF (GTP1/OBG family)
MPKAKPHVAAYPFTTLHPQVGHLEYSVCDSLNLLCHRKCNALSIPVFIGTYVLQDSRLLQVALIVIVYDACAGHITRMRFK